jgi:hypothetical protein
MFDSLLLFSTFPLVINRVAKLFMISDFFQKLSNNHPFITVCSYAGQEYVGVIQNRDDSVTTFYDYGSIVEHDLKRLFLNLGDQWWWESNRMIPINLFLREDWAPFKQFLRTFNNKGLVVLHGPVTSINDLTKKRIKRRSITLVRRVL